MPELRNLGEKEELARLQDRMNQLLNRYSSGMEQPESLGETEWIPPLDVMENKDDIVVRVDIPGLTPDEIDLSISGDILHIKGERMREVDREDENYHTIERAYGKFDRQIVLPARVKVDCIRASYKNGVLCVKLPKLEEEETGKVKIALE
jgi:HSP20 family protein